MIIFINGSINAGKSTVGKILTKEIPKSALIEIDVFHEMIAWMPIDDAVALNLENAVAVIRNFSKRGITSIVPYPLSEKNYRYVVDALGDLNEKIYSFTLSPTLAIALTDRGERELNDWERKRIAHHYEIGIQQPSFGEIIDNSHQMPEETAKIILDKLRKDQT